MRQDDRGGPIILSQYCAQALPGSGDWLSRGGMCAGYRVKPLTQYTLNRYRGENGNFVRVLGLDSRSFEADRADERVEIVDNALIEAVELGSLFGLQASITSDGAEKARSERGIDALEEFQKDEAN